MFRTQRLIAFILCLFIAATGCGDGSTAAPSPALDAAPPTDQLDVPGLDAFDVPDAPDRALPDDALDLDVPVDEVVALDASADVIALEDVLDAQRDGTPSDSVTTDAPDAACPSGSTLCGDTCVDLARDSANCGACRTSCRILANVNPDRVTCAAGHCVLDGACLADRGDCDHDVTNGCETDLATNMNCGRCGTTCSGSTPVCAMGPSDGGVVRTCTSGCTTMTPTRCGSSCVDTATDLANCGSCDHACSTPANARATCAASRCDFICNTGFHACGGACVTNTSIATCGTSCSPCTSPANATATCDGTACGIVCNAGYHLCGGACVSSTATSSCGASCSACATPANATATCDGTSCSFTCNAGFHNCGGACVSNTSPASCGSLCSPCATPSNATASCNGTTCGIVCNAGYHLCGSACLSNTDIASCGSSCSACPTAPGGHAACTSGVCAIVCDGGFHACGGTCSANTDIASCGSRCSPCPAPPANGHASCDGSTCGIVCDAGFDLVGAACTLTAPRLLAPPGTSTATSRRPHLRWALPSAAAVTVRLCRDRALTAACVTLAATTLTVDPTSELAPGVWFWRVERSAAGVMASSATWQFSVGVRSAPINTAWGTVPDFNGDGFADVIVGSAWDANVHVYHGSATGLGTSPVARLFERPPGAYYGQSVASAGDVNGDGFCDAIVSGGGADYLYFGSASGLPRSASQTILSGDGIDYGNLIGAPVAAAGDVNADGYGDVLVGNHAADGVRLYYGNATGVSSSPALIGRPVSTSLVASWGEAITSIDMNGDGFSDVVASAFTGDGVNAIFVFFGSTFGPRAVPIRIPGSGFTDAGTSVSNAWDVNGDGYGDLITGGFGAGFGDAEVFLGGASISTVPIVTLHSPVGGLGVAVAGAGDVNADGYADVIATDPGDAYIFLGNSSGVSSSPIASLTGRGGFGTSTAGAGDVNGDGYADVIVGGIEYARVFLGASTGIGAVLPDLYPSTSGMRFGFTVARFDPFQSTWRRVLFGRAAQRSWRDAS